MRADQPHASLYSCLCPVGSVSRDRVVVVVLFVIPFLRGPLSMPSGNGDVALVGGSRV